MREKKRREELKKRDKDFLINMIFQLEKDIQDIAKNPASYKELCEDYEASKKIEDEKLARINEIIDMSDKIESVVVNDDTKRQTDFSHMSIREDSFHFMSDRDDRHKIIVNTISPKGRAHTYYYVDELEEIEETDSEFNLYFMYDRKLTLIKGERPFYTYSMAKREYVKVAFEDYIADSENESMLIYLSNYENND